METVQLFDRRLCAITMANPGSGAEETNETTAIFENSPARPAKTHHVCCDNGSMLLGGTCESKSIFQAHDRATLFVTHLSQRNLLTAR